MSGHADTIRRSLADQGRHYGTLTEGREAVDAQLWPRKEPRPGVPEG